MVKAHPIQRLIICAEKWCAPSSSPSAARVLDFLPMRVPASARGRERIVQSSVEDDNLVFEKHSTDGSITLVVTFGSFTNPGCPAPAYALMNTLLGVQKGSGSPFDVLYLVANRNDWYFSGVRGLGDSMGESALALRKMTSPYEACLFIGNSMGGYAALAFGWQTRCDRILAFSPQTRFDRSFCDCIGERRWAAKRRLKQETHDVTAFRILDIMRQFNPPREGAAIHFGLQSSTDAAYAMHIADNPAVERIPYPDSGHDLAHDLRADGRLAAIIKQDVELLNARTAVRRAG